MADNERNFEEDENEETYEEIDNNYRRIEGNEDDENDEGTIEYLDLDLEGETLENYCTPEAIPPAVTKTAGVQASVLKTNYEPALSTIVPKPKPNSNKTATIIPERSIMQTRSSTGNFGNRSSVKRTADCLAPANVHTAVNNINAKLADSVKFVNGRVPKKALINNGAALESFVAPTSSKDSLKAERKSREMDSLDLFFQSMAQTVLNLPSQVQAKIKMDICKVIAMAEIKYCTSDAPQSVSKV